MSATIRPERAPAGKDVIDCMRVLVVSGVAAEACRGWWAFCSRCLTLTAPLGARGLFLTSNAGVTEQVRSVVGPVHGVWQFVSLAPLLLHPGSVLDTLATSPRPSAASC